MITYKVTKVKNPGKNAVEGTQYFAGKAVKTSDYTFEDLAEDINNSTTVTQADAYAVLKSIRKFVRNALLAGRRVVLTDLGALKINLRGKCYSQDTMAASDFSPASMITGIAVNFRPEASLLRDLRANYQLQRLSSEYLK